MNLTFKSLLRLLRKTPLRDLVRGRITGRLDIDQLLEESGLPGLAEGKVRHVVKRTRLWRLEKVDVAHELVAHFLDGIEADTPLDDLLETFGDEQQTAKLIRRAKKRQRPLVWHAFAWTRLSVLILSGVYVLSALYLLTGSPSVTTDYLAILNRKAAGVPADEAAWPIYREALVALDLEREIEWDTPDPNKEYYVPGENSDPYGGGYGMGGYPGYGYKTPGPPYLESRWSRLRFALRPEKPGWSETSVFLTEHAETLARVHLAAALPKSGYLAGFHTAPEDEVLFGVLDSSEHPYMGPHPPLVGALLSHLTPLRQLAWLLAADVSRAVQAGDGDTALADGVAILGLARHADEQTTLINGMVRVSLQELAYRSIQEVMATRPDIWSDDQLRDLAHGLASIEMAPEDWYNGERLWFYDFLQRAYTDDGRGGGQVTHEGAGHLIDYSGESDLIDPVSLESITLLASLPAASVLVAPRAEMRQKYDSFIDHAISETHQPLWQRDDTKTLEAMALEMHESTMQHIRYLPLTIMLPATTSSRYAIETERGERDGVLVGIALELYRREHGDWPGALEALVPTYLPSVPVDRLTGEPVRYRVSDSRPVVYSIGVDGDDDGGRPPVKPEDGTPSNHDASPSGLRSRSDLPACDGDWVLWPGPREE